MSGKNYSAHPPQNAILCIDYANVFGVISQHTDYDQPDAVVLDLVRDLQRHLLKELNLKTIRTLLFASLPPNHVTGHRATGVWLAAGIEPRFSYARSTDEASAIDMAMESIEISRNAGKETAFILLSGNQWFIPLVQRLQRTGHQVVMATLESPSHSDHLPEDCKEAFMNAQFLLSGNGKRFDSGQKSNRVQESSELEETKRPVETTVITDEVVKHTLEIIDASFGQYEEIYLTPLLRKLSEIFEDSDDDPKALINELEVAGAVWLEKRRGFPHNYTVLMMNEDHPDVAELKEARLQNTDSGYDYDFYDDYSDSDGDAEDYQLDDEDQYPE